MSTLLPHVRPGSRERMVACGVGALSDPELVALFIGTGCAGRNCIQVSADLLRYAGSLRELLLMHSPAVRRLPWASGLRATRAFSPLWSWRGVLVSQLRPPPRAKRRKCVDISSPR